MAKFRIGTIETPDRAAVGAALEVREPANLNAAVVAAERHAEENRTTIRRLSSDVVRLREAVARNAASPQALESKLLEFGAAEQCVDVLARAIVSAREARQHAIRAQTDDKIALAMQFRDELQAILDRDVTPLLDEIKTLERQLDASVQRMSDGRVSQVPALSWPSSNLEEAATFNGVAAMVATGSRAR